MRLPLISICIRVPSGLAKRSRNSTSRLHASRAGLSDQFEEAPFVSEIFREWIEDHRGKVRKASGKNKSEFKQQWDGFFKLLERSAGMDEVDSNSRTRETCREPLVLKALESATAHDKQEEYVRLSKKYVKQKSERGMEEKVTKDAPSVKRSTRATDHNLMDAVALRKEGGFAL